MARYGNAYLIFGLRFSFKPLGKVAGSRVQRVTHELRHGLGYSKSTAHVTAAVGTLVAFNHVVDHEGANLSDALREMQAAVEGGVVGEEIRVQLQVAAASGVAFHVASFRRGGALHDEGVAVPSARAEAEPKTAVVLAAAAATTTLATVIIAVSALMHRRRQRFEAGGLGPLWFPLEIPLAAAGVVERVVSLHFGLRAAATTAAVSGALVEEAVQVERAPHWAFVLNAHGAGAALHRRPHGHVIWHKQELHRFAGAELSGRQAWVGIDHQAQREELFFGFLEGVCSWWWWWYCYWLSRWWH